jgi:hypothetical protein
VIEKELVIGVKNMSFHEPIMSPQSKVFHVLMQPNILVQEHRSEDLPN